MFLIYTRGLPAFLISSFKYCSSFAVSRIQHGRPRIEIQTLARNLPWSCLQEQALPNCLKTRPPLPTKPSLCYKEATAEPGRGTSPSTSSTELKLGENYLSCKHIYAKTTSLSDPIVSTFSRRSLSNGCTFASCLDLTHATSLDFSPPGVKSTSARSHVSDRSLRDQSFPV